MHFNSPLWCLELFSAPEGLHVTYTYRQLTLPPARGCVGTEAESLLWISPRAVVSQSPTGGRVPVATCH